MNWAEGTYEIVLLDCGDGVYVDPGDEAGDGRSHEDVSEEEGTASSL